jgi:integrase/recombinase XerD
MEKEYVCGLSKTTLKGYRVTWRTFDRLVKEPEITKGTFLRFVKEAKDFGLKTKSINTHISVLNSFLTWLSENGHKPENIRIKKLKAKRTIQPSYTDDELLKIARWKPGTWAQTRLKMIVLTLMDTGCRVDEILTLRRKCVDLDNMFIKVLGKGSKERIVPMSIVLRKYLYQFSKIHYFDLFFPSRTGNLLDYNNCLGDLKTMCFKLRIPCKAFHGFRRTFARGFIKNGGDVFSLQHILGHTDINTTRIYVDLNPNELKKIHLKNSTLSRLK